MPPLFDVCGDDRTVLRERRARLSAQLTFAQVWDWFGLNEARSGSEDPCPACHAPGLNFLRRASGHPRPGRLQRLTSDLRAAGECACSVCGHRSDPIGYVQARLDLTSTAATLDRVEAFLDGSEAHR